MAELLISDEDWNAPLEEDEVFEKPTSPAWQNLQSASQGDPDSYARDLELSNRTGVPVQAVGSQRDEIAKRDAISLIKESDWNKPLSETENPAVAKYLEDPNAAQISYDDISILTGLENETRRNWIEVDERVFEGLGDSMMIGMGKTYDQAAIAMLQESYRGQDFDFMAIQNPIGAAWKKLSDSITMAMEGEEGTEAWNKEIDRRIEYHKASLATAEQEIARLTPQGLTVAEEGARGGLQMIADMAPGLGISVATRGRFNPTLGYLTGKTYLESYGSAIVAGKDNETAKRYGAIDALLEYSTERIPTKHLEKIFGELGKGGIKSSIKKWLVGEAAGEQVATLTQSLNAYAHDLDEELAGAKDLNEVLEIQGRRQAVTFISTLVGGGSMAGTLKGIDYAVNREQRAMAKVIEKTNKRRGSEYEQERLDNMIYLAQASKTNQRAADMFEDFMGNAAADQQVFMTAEGVDLLNDPPAYILEQMDGSGGEVAIPLATFLKDFANDEAKLELVRPHIKTSEGLTTQTEMKEDTDSDYIQELLAQAAEATETKNAADEIYQRITEQLVATGRQSAATARQSAALIPAQVTTQYEYLKSIGYKKEDGSEVTLEELFADFGLEIVGPEVEITSDFMTQIDSEMDQAVAKGMPMDQISRLTRAQEMGFDIDNVYYHGTTARGADQDFEAFEPGPDRPFIFVSKDPQFADKFNDLPGFDLEYQDHARIIPLYVKAGNTFDFETMSQAEIDSLHSYLVEQYAQKHQEYLGYAQREFEAWNNKAEAGAFRFSSLAHWLERNEMDDLAWYVDNTDNPAEQYAEQQATTQVKLVREGNWKVIEGQEDAAEMQGLEDRTVMDWIRREGYGSFFVSEFIPGAGRQKSLAVMDPSQLRSVNAAFDPDFSASPRVLSQQNFGNIALTETVLDEAGMPVDITESANSLWKQQQQRQANLDALRRCFNG